MTVYEALVQAQHDSCNMAERFGLVFEQEPEMMEASLYLEQQYIDRAYLLGVAIDNLPADVASMEV